VMTRLLAFLLVLVSCSSPTGLLSGSELAQLDVAEARWKQRGFADYSYETRTLCFCPPEVNKWTRVYVRGGIVTRAEEAETTPPVEVTNRGYWHPIDTAFARLRASVKNSTDQVYSDIKVEFDQTVGYPTLVEYVSKPNVADAGSTTQRRNLKPLP
jgi:hypothetical protein